jgi:predicted dehydrogenase
VRFVGVSRKGGDILRHVQTEWGFEVASERYEDVLASGVDICLIASPAALHHEHARAALEAGAHVLVEKPFTLDSDSAWDLVEIARRMDRHIVVGFGWKLQFSGAKCESDDARSRDREH